MDDVDIADETTEDNAGADADAQQFAELGQKLYGEDFDVEEVEEYRTSKDGYVKRHNDMLTEAGRARDKAVELAEKVLDRDAAVATPAPQAQGPTINAASFAHEMGFNAADFSSDPARMWEEPITLRQLYASMNGVATWGKNKVEELYGGAIPENPADRVSLTSLGVKSEKALETALSNDTLLNGMLTEATVEDLVKQYDLAERDDIRKGLDEYDASSHGDLDSYIDGVAKASHEKFEGKLAEKSGRETSRRTRTSRTLRTGKRGGGIPRGEKEPSPWTEEGMRVVAARLREQQSFGE